VVVIITEREEFSRDWDWYAVDQDGHLGHFTSAGMRVLPKSVREDREAIERIEHYFFEQAPVRGGWSVPVDVGPVRGGLKKVESGRYLKDFALMASKGLYSFDTDLIRGQEGRYFLVAIPERVLEIDDLPPDIRELVSHTCAGLQLVNCRFIDEATTTTW
jgi:hypothetical protein